MEEERRLHRVESNKPEPLDDEVRQILGIPDIHHQIASCSPSKRKDPPYADGSDKEVELDPPPANEADHLNLSSHGNILIFFLVSMLLPYLHLDNFR